LKSDFRFGEAVWNTFPWPQSPTVKQIDDVALAAQRVRLVRATALAQMKGGLRALYRTLELPGTNPLKDAHAALDAAILTAYGFSLKKDLLAQLLALNQHVAAKIDKGETVAAPGVPKHYKNVEKLVTEDCITPSGAPKPHQPDDSTAQSYGDAAHYYAIKEEPPPYRTK
jgi:hypothetical protein